MKYLENIVLNVVVRKHITFEKVCQNKRSQHGVHNFDFHLTGEYCGEYNYELNISRNCIGLLFDVGMCYYKEGYERVIN